LETNNLPFIHRAKFEQFSQFDNLDIEFARHINIISGETSVGKTHVMKALYSIGKTLNELEAEKKAVELLPTLLADKFNGVFHSNQLLQLIMHGKTFANCELQWTNNKSLSCQFSIESNDSITIEGYEYESERPNFIYLPVKEIISATTSFSSLYKQFSLPFEETYFDLSKLLSKDTKDRFIEYGKKLLKMLEDMLQGKTICEDETFYLLTNTGEKIEMGLVAEGYRKIATLMRLIENGSITANSIIFWDEPEANMNPKMVPFMKDLLISLAKMGAQIFMTTHSYFVLQELSLFCEYENKDELDIRFITLYRNEETGMICHEAKKTATELDHNPIQEEFEELYNKENDLFYE